MRMWAYVLLISTLDPVYTCIQSCLLVIGSLEIKQLLQNYCCYRLSRGFFCLCVCVNFLHFLQYFIFRIHIILRISYAIVLHFQWFSSTPFQLKCHSPSFKNILTLKELWSQQPCVQRPDIQCNCASGARIRFSKGALN